MTLAVDQIREELFRRIDEANAQHALLEGFRIALLDPGVVVGFNRNVRFFSTVEVSLFYSLVVILYSLFETRSNTVSFKTLIDSLEATHGIESVRELRNRITGLKPYIIKVCILRNEAVGHQSTGRPLSDTHTRANLLYSDVEALLTETKTLFQDISTRYFHISSSFRDDSHLASIAVLVALKPKDAP